MAQLKVSQTKSSAGAKSSHRDTLRTLGLKKIGQSVVRDDTPEVRGMIKAVAHMVAVEEV